MNTTQQAVLIVQAPFYQDITGQLLQGATTVLEQAGYAHETVTVPGVFEIPAAIRFALRAMELGSASRRYVGFVTLGCVIRGETDHYEFICRAATDALMNLSTEFAIAHGLGILTCENQEQAWVRADITQKNLGGRAAEACLAMIGVKNKFHLAT
ncbi:MAG: 6,7-dimethyl-8-ribityllumazine synthase [Magnetospiraceae bacterium]